ncbi:hypothetical protein MNBD_CHLOROFLEXI01-1012, partial [hydrothermal vent metagenome]
EIVLAADQTLTLLTAEGEAIWSVPLTTVTLPQSLSAFSSVAASKEWVAQYNVQVRQIEPFDYDGDGRYEILLLFSNSTLQLFDQNGKIIWTDNRNSSPTLDIQAFIQVADFNQDGQEEVALGFFNPRLRFSQLRLINGNKEDIWQQPQPISNRISAITIVPFAQTGELYLAVGSEGGQIHLLNYDRQRVWWPRTLNKPITALVTATLDGQQLLMAGTEAGVVVAYRPNGSRLWTRRLVAEANRPVISLSTAEPAVGENAPLLAVTLGPEKNSSRVNDVLLLGSSNRTLATYDSVDANGLSRLLDINEDGRYELLVTRFARVELLGLGVGTSEIALEWSYSLDSEPGAILVVDFDRDGEDELVIGAKDGRLHYLNQQNNVDWLVSPGGTITHLALLKRGQQQRIVVIRSSIIIGPDNQEQQQSWIDVRDTSGEQLWEEPIDAQITSLLIQDINERGDPEIIVGTQTGDIIAFTSEQTELWRESIAPENEVGNAVTQLLLIKNTQTEQPLLIASAANKLYAVPIRTLFRPPLIAVYEAPIASVFRLDQPGKELATRLLVLTDGIATGLTWRGIQMPAWPIALEGNPTISIPANDLIEEAFEESTAESFLIATDQAELIRLHIEDSKPNRLWRLIGPNGITSLSWGNLTGDALPEIVVGNSEGQVSLYDYQTELIDKISLSSGVFKMVIMHRADQQNGDLVVLTENGVVQQFRAKENRPPLLTNPQANGQYSFGVTVTDVEGDEVTLRLEIFNPANGRWESQGTEIVANGNDRRFWSVPNPPITDKTVLYRFYYDDGAYDGLLPPQIQPIELVDNSLLNPTTTTLTVAGLLFAIGLFLL